MLKAYAVALALSTSAPVAEKTENTADKQAEKIPAQTTTEVKGPRPKNKKMGILF